MLMCLIVACGPSGDRGKGGRGLVSGGRRSLGYGGRSELMMELDFQKFPHFHPKIPPIACEHDLNRRNPPVLNDFLAMNLINELCNQVYFDS